jgi:CheY-like chemotaxis protein
MTAPEETPPSNPNAGKTVLVVEDDPRSARLFAMMLEREGYKVVQAATGEEALACAAKSHPMAIVLDILLPGMDGWQVLTELKRSPDTRDIPVVITSVLDRQALGFQLGAIEYLTKPVDRQQLLRAIGQCLHGKKPAFSARKVMVVHHNPDELRHLAAMLWQEGYDVIEALGVEEGMNLLQTVHPDVLVTDLMLSGEENSGMIASLYETPAYAHLPVVLLTSQELSSDQKVWLLGKIQYVAIGGKSGNSALLSAINEILSGSEPQDAH